MPLTAGALLPLLRLLGAVAVMVTVPGVRHVAMPLELTVAMAALELAQIRPLLELRARVVLLLILPVAVKATCPWGTLAVAAGFGAIVMARSLGLLLPHPDNMPARETIKTRLLNFMFISGALDSPGEWGGWLLGNEPESRSLSGYTSVPIWLSQRENGYNPSLSSQGKL